MVGAADNRLPAQQAAGALGIKLSSPWDVAWWPAADVVAVAMAGNHTLWVFDPRAGRIEPLAGTMNEGLQDGAARRGLVRADVRPRRRDATATRGARLWLADSEVSALRYVDLAPADDAVGDDTLEVVRVPRGADERSTVGTAVGAGPVRLRAARRRRRPGAAAAPARRRRPARRLDRRRRHLQRRGAPLRPGPDGGPGAVTTLARDLAEPSGLVVLPSEDGIELLVVESAAHRLTRLRLPRDVAGEILDAGAHRTQRPVTDVGARRVPAGRACSRPAAGQKYDDRYGPSTRLQVSATPPELLLDGHRRRRRPGPRAADRPGRRRGRPARHRARGQLRRGPGHRVPGLPPQRAGLGRAGARGRGCRADADPAAARLTPERHG